MDARVVAEFRMECSGHGVALANGDRIISFDGQNFDAFAYAGNLRSADENHFEGRSTEFALADGTVDLPAIRIAANIDVERPQAGLFGVFHLRSEQNRAGTSAEGRFNSYKLLEFGEARLSQQFEKRARLASGDDEPVDVIQFFRLLDEHDLSAEFFQSASVRVKISL